MMYMPTFNNYNHKMILNNYVHTVKLNITRLINGQCICQEKKNKELKVTFLKSQPTDDRPTPQSCDLHTKKIYQSISLYR